MCYFLLKAKTLPLIRQKITLAVRNIFVILRINFFKVMKRKLRIYTVIQVFLVMLITVGILFMLNIMDIL